MNMYLSDQKYSQVQRVTKYIIDCLRTIFRCISQRHLGTLQDTIPIRSEEKDDLLKLDFLRDEYRIKEFLQQFNFQIIEEAID